MTFIIICGVDLVG